MNYTPNDLQNITFKKTVRGYSEKEVNELIDKVIEDYSKFIKENIELKDRIVLFNEGMQHYRNIEESLQNALVIAQKTGEEVKKNAYDKADVIVKDAEIRAKQILAEMNEEVLRIKYEYEETKKKLSLYKIKAETLLISQLEVLKEMNEKKDEYAVI